MALTGFSPMQNDMIGVQTHDMERAEALGIPVAFLLLVLTLAAVMAALVPLAMAIAGLLAAFGVLFALTAVMPLDAMAVSMASMIDIGVGIDYAMFIVSRFREELARTGATDRAGVAEAVGIALATAGRTILASGLVVMVSLCSLVVVRATIFRGIAIGVATAVLCTLVLAMTLLPATLAKLGPAISRGALPARYRPAELRDDTEPRGGGWARWAHVVMARPLLFGGAAAEFVDISDEITAKVPLVVALVLGTSFVFLVFAFRSLVLPVKAVLMNLLATGAALGVTVMVFQWGVGANVLNFQSTGFLQVYLPTIVFAVLFGLSMDYEVFLIHRMKESWEATGDNDDAVATGIQHTARPITAAAAIMIVIFGSFVTADVLEVPALMRLFGHWNWWLPKVRTG